MQSTHRMYPAAKNSTQYLTICQTTHLRADLLHFPGPKKLPKLVSTVSLITQKQFLDHLKIDIFWAGPSINTSCQRICFVGHTFGCFM